jgi:hypothetical protein
VVDSWSAEIDEDRLVLEIRSEDVLNMTDVEELMVEFPAAGKNISDMFQNERNINGLTPRKYMSFETRHQGYKHDNEIP